MSDFDEQGFLQLTDRCRARWDAGVQPPRHDLGLLLNQIPQVIAELIRTRQQLRAARAEAGTLPLPLLPPPQPTQPAHA